MAVPPPSPPVGESIGLRSITEAVIPEAIGKYVDLREEFFAVGGERFLAQRRELRSLFCKTDISQEALLEWARALHPESLRGEMIRRFTEWNKKVELRLLKKEEPATIAADAFLRQAGAFAAEFSEFIDSRFFSQYIDAKSQLRDLMLVELRTQSVDEVARKFDIQDAELLARIKKEWTWKA